MVVVVLTDADEKDPDRPDKNDLLFCFLSSTVRCWLLRFVLSMIAVLIELLLLVLLLLLLLLLSLVLDKAVSLKSKLLEIDRVLVARRIESLGMTTGAQYLISREDGIEKEDAVRIIGIRGFLCLHL